MGNAKKGRKRKSGLEGRKKMKTTTSKWIQRRRAKQWTKDEEGREEWETAVEEKGRGDE